MNFDFSEDQKMLKEQVSKFLSDNCSLDVARDILESDKTYSEEGMAWFSRFRFNWNSNS